MIGAFHSYLLCNILSEHFILIYNNNHCIKYAKYKISQLVLLTSLFSIVYMSNKYNFVLSPTFGICANTVKYGSIQSCVYSVYYNNIVRIHLIQKHWRPENIDALRTSLFDDVRADPDLSQTSRMVLFDDVMISLLFIRCPGEEVVLSKKMDWSNSFMLCVFFALNFKIVQVNISPRADPNVSQTTRMVVQSHWIDLPDLIRANSS